MSETVKGIRDAIVIKLHKYSDDISLPTKLLYQEIIDIRSSLIRDEIKRSKTLSVGFYQLVSTLVVNQRKTECVGSRHVLSGFKVDVKGISKTVRNPILYIGSHDLNEKYDILELVPFLSHGYRRYATEKPVCTILEDMIVFNRKPYGRKLTALMLFDNFINIEGFSETADIPVPAGIAFRLKTLVMKSILETFGIMNDPINDDSDESVQRKQPVSNERDNNN
ncbi:MAG: hypothetical protein DRP97_01005 [Candidatus Latescibacterota bacterium]|nr:MAG: hypothetical protein DRP97_01005 [Candidatus Latescibacterota bacterium]